jgi:copper homeostasis protein
VSGLFLEVIVCTPEDAIEAARGGADRLEIARDLTRQGLSPDPDIVRRILREVDLPARVMVREADDFLCNRPGELPRLCESAREFEALGVDGLILGFSSGGTIDDAPLRALLSAAPRLRATFHRAFDTLNDPASALEHLKTFVQVDRVLSGGGDGDWKARCARLAVLAARAHPRLTMLPGGGVDGEAIEQIVRTPRLIEAHVGRAARVPSEVTAPVSAEAVRELRRRAALAQVPGM